ncbi:MAG: LysE family translocator [Lachnospiraceae bacterium]
MELLPADFFIYVIVTLITPGPNTIMAMHNGARYGIFNSLRFLLGIYSGFTALMLMCLLFSRTVYRLLPQIRPLLLAVGAVYMLYQAWKCWNRCLSIENAPHQGRFLEGIFLQLVNPKATVFGITTLTNYVIVFTASLRIQLLYCVVLSTISFGCIMLWAVFGSALGKLFVHREQLINRIMACLLCYCAWKLIVP